MDAAEGTGGGGAWAPSTRYKGRSWMASSVAPISLCSIILEFASSPKLLYVSFLDSWGLLEESSNTTFPYMMTDSVLCKLEATSPSLLALAFFSRTAVAILDCPTFTNLFNGGLGRAEQGHFVTEPSPLVHIFGFFTKDVSSSYATFSSSS
ncbi:hypothetical protein Fot_19735 [Forsythia ovata]|uniref:Uncharacterized protein n=1 Tax=Forsythia ovata TaxID=205694 RepID=A0ABD1VLV2_9LAMI